MYVTSVQHSTLVAVTAMILSQVVAHSLRSFVYAVMIDACIFRSICWMVSMVIALLCSGNVGYLESHSGVALSFPRTCLIRNLFINDCSLKVNRRGYFYIFKDLI